MAWTRERLKVRLEDWLRRRSLPRLQMSLLVMATGASALLFSFLLLKAGVASMAVRYPLAIVLAYGVFLALVWLWIQVQRGDEDDAVPDPGGLGDVFGYSGHDAPAPVPWAGGGGRGGGGGASASFAETSAAVDGSVADAGSGSLPVSADASAPSSGGGGSGGFSFDFDELAVVIAVIAMVAAVLGASVYVIWIAPEFFAEVLADALIGARVYRNLKVKQAQRRDWLQTALRKSAVPVVIMAVVFGVAGGMLAEAAPGARTLGEVLRYVPDTE